MRRGTQRALLVTCTLSCCATGCDAWELLFDKGAIKCDSDAACESDERCDADTARCVPRAPDKPKNRAPSAVDDVITIDEDEEVDIDVLGNDSDPDGDTLFIVDVVEPPPGGTAEVNGRVIHFTPPAEASGVFSFSYGVRDEHDATEVAVVTVTVELVDDVPTATLPDAVVVPEDGSVELVLTGVDVDSEGIPLLVNISDAPDHGTLSPAITGDGALAPFTATYVPAGDHVGTDAFAFTVGHGTTTSAPRSVSITVTPVNDAPGANADSGIAVVEGETVFIDVLANDVITPDADEELRIESVAQNDSALGTAVEDGGQIRYTAPIGDAATDGFDYVIADRLAGDPDALTASSTVTVTLTPGFSVGGTVERLQGSGLVLGLNGAPLGARGATAITASSGAPRAFTFEPLLAEGASYQVSILQQPQIPRQTCEIVDGSGDGTVAELGAAVTSVRVVCSAFVEQVASGASITCVRVNGGAVRCWGDNEFRTLGFPTGANHLGDEPNEVPQDLVDVRLGAPATDLCVNLHACAILEDGGVKCWGRNDFGQLGRNDSDATLPFIGEDAAAIETMPAIALGAPALSISCGQFHTCALLDGGDVKCWGLSTNGQLGADTVSSIGDAAGELGALLAVDLGGGGTVKATAVSAGAANSCAILESGDVKCWGQANTRGISGGVQAGDAPGGMGNALLPVDLDGNRAAHIVSGNQHVCAVLEDASLRCWGANGAGQLGYDSIEADIIVSPGPVAVGSGVQSVVAGIASTCALLDANVVKCWGDASEGTLGLSSGIGVSDGEGPSISTLTGINLGTPLLVHDLALNTAHVCARFESGAIKCWGDGNRGSLGRGDSEDFGDDPEEIVAELPFVDVGG